MVERVLNAAEDTTHTGAFLTTLHQRNQPNFRREATFGRIIAIVQSDAFCERREEAGRILSVIGDPRNLVDFATMPGRTVTMGSTSHPNSLPIHEVYVAPFRMCIFPVVNLHYALFARATHRRWLSPDATDPQLRNAPATEVTWDDARAYCAWVTKLWRAEKEIGDTEIVRLPTEPEWEYAARGTMGTVGDGNVLYPWGLEPLLPPSSSPNPQATPEARKRYEEIATVMRGQEPANYDALRFHCPVAVGIFPRGASRFGCLDMSGNVWEWCSTASENLRSQQFRYPWVKDDGRENVREKVRGRQARRMKRVIRGGCFCSPKEQLSVSYRACMRETAHWGGLGFRVVISSQ